MSDTYDIRYNSAMQRFDIEAGKRVVASVDTLTEALDYVTYQMRQWPLGKPFAISSNNHA